MPDTLYLGLDVARDQLGVAVYPTGEAWRVANTPAATPASSAGRRPGRPPASCWKPPAAMRAAGLPAVVGNPRQVRDFARRRNSLAKTDRLDARVLARFAAEVQPPANTGTPWSPAGANSSPTGSPSSSGAPWPRPSSAPTWTPTWRG